VNEKSHNLDYPLGVEFAVAKKLLFKLGFPFGRRLSVGRFYEPF